MQVTRVTVSIPAMPMLVSNLVGLISLSGLAVSVGAIAGSWWWTVLIASVAGLGLAWVAASHAQAAAAPAAVEDAPPQPLRVAR